MRTFTYIGEALTARDANGDCRVRIATIFPGARTIVTAPPMHVLQREAFIQAQNQLHADQGKPPLTESEQVEAMESSVDLLADEQGIYIRPDPLRMDLAFAADELLQELDEVPKWQIKYLLLTDRRVRDSLKHRGEYWRMFLPPTKPNEIHRLIAESRSKIDGRPIYYYSPVTGTRLLTYQSFASLADLKDEELRAHLVEIAAYAPRRNRNGFREVDLFMADGGPPIPEIVAVSKSSAEELRPQFKKLCEQVRETIPPVFQRDDLDEPHWRNRMFARLMTQRDDARADDQTTGLDPDFSMRVHWVPGGRIDEGELILDPAIDQPNAGTDVQTSTVLRSLILNLVQEFGDLEYLNLGSVLPAARRDERRGGRREVYVVQLKQRGAPGEILQIIRMQKWGVREHLDKGKTMEEAIVWAEEYSEYVLDRRLACRQLGMNLPLRQTARKLPEIYDGSNRRYAGARIWTPYFQRDYIAGVATNQISARKLADPAYMITFARLLGQAAAPNIIVGRAELTGEVVFDVGDEIVVENPRGLPVQIFVSDQVGTFVDWTGTLESRAAGYAAPIMERLSFVPDRQGFIHAYLCGFTERFVRIQQDCNKHKRAFDTLFKYRPYDPAGSLSCRWQFVLNRLRAADSTALAAAIRRHIKD